MLKVQIAYKNNKFSSLVMKGHADSAEYGHDLVCAGASAVVIGGLNNIRDIKQFKVHIAEGDVNVEAIGEISQHDEVVLETIVSGLKTLQEDNKQFIKIEIL